MESFFSRFKNALVLIAILLAQTIALAMQVRRPADPTHPDSSEVRLLRLWTTAIVAPFERAATHIGHSIRWGWADYVDLRHVRAEDRDLHQQLAEFRLQQAAVAEDALQGIRLQRLLAFRQQYVAATLPAQVIGTSGSDQSHLLLIDKGADFGLKPDMPVITPDGIVGKLRDVFPHTAQLLLINDPSSGAGVLLQSSRIRAILRGSVNGKVLINSLTADDRVKPGEIVLTSGGDQVFPRGLAVGTIASVAPDPDHQPYTTIVLKPAANLFQLEEVLIITGLQSSLKASAEQQLAEDSAAHAADIAAQRLPSLAQQKPAELHTDPNTANPEAESPPDNSTSLVPKPKPVLHPDRFSPGTTPPAADLAPGARKPQPETVAPELLTPEIRKPAHSKPALTRSVPVPSSTEPTPSKEAPPQL